MDKHRKHKSRSIYDIQYNSVYITWSMVILYGISVCFWMHLGCWMLSARVHVVKCSPLRNCQCVKGHYPHKPTFSFDWASKLQTLTMFIMLLDIAYFLYYKTGLFTCLSGILVSLHKLHYYHKEIDVWLCNTFLETQLMSL